MLQGMNNIPLNPGYCTLSILAKRLRGYCKRWAIFHQIQNTQNTFHQVRDVLRTTSYCFRWNECNIPCKWESVCYRNVQYFIRWNKGPVRWKYSIVLFTLEWDEDLGWNSGTEVGSTKISGRKTCPGYRNIYPCIWKMNKRCSLLYIRTDLNPLPIWTDFAS